MNLNYTLLKLLFFTIVLFPLQPAVYCQNFGLKQPQDKSTLPHSREKIIFPKQNTNSDTLPKLNKINPDEFQLQKGWKLIEAVKCDGAGKSISSSHFDTSHWYNATVPGTVLTTLVDQGVYPDPFYGLNNLSIPDSLSRQSWWYRMEFNAPKSSKNKSWLILNGINYKARVWFNGHLLGKIEGAFLKKKFDISHYINEDKSNILAIHIFPPPNPGIPHEESPTAGAGPNGGQLCLDGPTFISSEGWDWIPGIRDRNIGIWQDVRLRFSGAITFLEDPQVITDLNLPDTTKAKVLIKGKILNTSQIKKTVNLIGSIEDKKVSEIIHLEPNERKSFMLSPEKFKELIFENPRLWWPNGYGEQNLYNLNLSINDEDGHVLNQKTIRFGIRELSYELSVAKDRKHIFRIELNPMRDYASGKPIVNNRKRVEILPSVEVPSLENELNIKNLFQLKDKTMSPYLVIKVNGKRIFCKGGNWGMDDGMKRVTRERLEPAMKLHQKANFNMVRNWTGENTEELFYDLCDEYGMLVWNDFWMSTEGYNLEPNDNNLFLKNARSVIKRFRNHPSIAIWCPRNEGYAPPKLEKKLQKLAINLDGTRYYQGNSRNLNLRPSGPWNYLANAKEYYTDKAFGFSTELGTPSVPSANSIRKMMSKKDLWPISDVWYYHDFHEGQSSYVGALENLYGKPKNLEDFCKKAQFINYDSHRAMFEAWNSKLWDNTSGLLMWMSHPAWPSFVWQLYSWDFETFGSYYACKKACEPVHIQMNLDNNEVVVVNTSLRSYDRLIAKLEIYNLQAKKIYSKSRKLSIASNKLVSCFTPNLPENLPEIYFVRLKLTYQNDNIISENDYWKKSKKTKDFDSFNNLPLVHLSFEILEETSTTGNRMTFSIKNNTNTPAINVTCNLINRENNKILLPAYFSDGYFTLLPGESKTIQVEYPNDERFQNATISLGGYNFEK